MSTYVSAETGVIDNQKNIIQQENQLEQSTVSVKQKIQSIEIEIQSIKKEIQRELKNYEGIATLITTSDRCLAAFSLIFAVVVIGLGVYVTWLVGRVKIIKEASERLLMTHKDIEAEVTELNKSINEKLYLGILKAETEYIISRLQKVPEDIDNLFTKLVSRPLLRSHYASLKSSYMSLKNRHDSPAQFILDRYLLVIFQHFAGLGLLDDDISSDLEGRYSIIMRGCFRCDVEKSTGDIIEACIDNNLSDHKDKLLKYCQALKNSQYRGSVCKIIYNKLISKENRFLFYEIINVGTDIDKIKIDYGKLVINDYEADATNTISQKTILEKIISDATKESST